MGCLLRRPSRLGNYFYVGDLIKNLNYARRLEKEYEEKDLGSFMYYFKYKERNMCVDATNDIFHQGRMINDAEKGDIKQNCAIKIVEVDNDPHLCIFASRDIKVGEELRYDYGVQNLPWRRKWQKKLQAEGRSIRTNETQVTDKGSPVQASEDDSRKNNCIQCRSDQDQILSSPVPSENSEADDTDRDRDYVPSKNSDVSSDESEIIQTITANGRFTKKSPMKSATEIDLKDIGQNKNHNETKGSVCSEEDETKNSDCLSSQITIPKTNNTEYRHYDKRFYCLFCERPFAKLQKHLVAKHKDEEDVQKYMTENNKKVRDLLFEKMRNVGNHLHNSSVIKSGMGELAVAYRPRENQSLTADDYGPCPNCFAYYPRKDLWRHNKTCKFAPEDSRRRRHAFSSRLLLPQRKENSGTLAKVLAGLKLDEVSRIAKSDPTILSYGEKLSSKKGHDAEQHNFIRQKLREVARLVQEMRQSDGNCNKSLEDFIYPDKFKFIVKCCKSVAGFDSATNTYSTPSLALKIGGTLQKCLKILITKAIENGNKDLQSRAEALSTLFDFNWTDEISSNALRTLSEGKRNSNTGLLPLASDVKLMSEYLRTEADACAARLQNEYGYDEAKQDWVRLSEICLTQTILFNRRRAGEVSKMTVEDFKKKSLTNTDCELDGKLTKFERALCKSLYRTEIVAKRGRTAPVIFTPQLNMNIELLLKKRHLINNTENVYLFPTQTTNTHIRGTDCIRQFAGQCGADQPDRLRSTKLRKHIATMTQLINLKENELDILANFLGHDIRVHREFYRLPEATVQVAKVSKLLLLMEGGKVDRATSLDDIDIEEDTISGQENEDGELSESSEDDDSKTTTADTTLTEPSPSTSSETTTTDAKMHRRKTDKMKKKQWSNRERNAVFKHFERNIAMGSLPGKRDIDKCLAQETDLTGRTWRNVKDFCRNTIISKTKKK